MPSAHPEPNRPKNLKWPNGLAWNKHRGHYWCWVAVLDRYGNPIKDPKQRRNKRRKQKLSADPREAVKEFNEIHAVKVRRGVATDSLIGAVAIEYTKSIASRHGEKHMKCKNARSALGALFSAKDSDGNLIIERDMPVGKLKPWQWTQVHEDWKTRPNVETQGGLNTKTGYAASTISRWVTEVRTMFRWAKDQGYIKEHPDLGGVFKKPSLIEIKVEQDENPHNKVIFKPSEIQALLAFRTRRAWWKPAVLLGLNCGYDFNDIRKMKADIGRQLGTGKLAYQRQKTKKRNQERRVNVLWDETEEALLDYFENVRPKALQRVGSCAYHGGNDGQCSDHFFILRDGQCMMSTGSDSLMCNALDRARNKANIQRKGLTFHKFRKVVETIGANVGANTLILKRYLGHSTSGDISATYLVGDAIDEMKRITDAVHRYAFADTDDDYYRLMGERNPNAVDDKLPAVQDVDVDDLMQKLIDGDS